MESLKPLLEGWLAQAVQGDGDLADPEDIVLAARSFCDFYVSAVRWSLRVRSANVPEEFRTAARLIAHTMNDAMHQIEGYGHRVIQLTRLELSKPEADRQPMNLGMRISIDDVTHQAVHAEFVRLTKLAESGQLEWKP